MKSILPDGRVVVQLQSLSLPPERIIGLRVFHPMAQQGSTPCWNETDEEDIPTGKPAYSEGCVKFVKYDELAQVHRGLARASFEGGDVGGHRLTYAFRDLWILETEVPSASDAVQFAHLLSEVNLLLMRTTRHALLCERMGLTMPEINDLFGRAQNAWDAHKNRQQGKPNPPTSPATGTNQDERSPS